MSLEPVARGRRHLDRRGSHTESIPRGRATVTFTSLPDEDTGTGLLSGEIFSGDDTNLTPERRSTDTQGEFLAQGYDAAYRDVFGSDETDLPNLTPGEEQWRWAQEQLADARAAGQVVLVQFHHAAYSNGVHGTPPNHTGNPRKN